MYQLTTIKEVVEHESLCCVPEMPLNHKHIGQHRAYICWCGLLPGPQTELQLMRLHDDLLNLGAREC